MGAVKSHRQSHPPPHHCSACLPWRPTWCLGAACGQAQSGSWTPVARLGMTPRFLCYCGWTLPQPGLLAAPRLHHLCGQACSDFLALPPQPDSEQFLGSAATSARSVSISWALPLWPGTLATSRLCSSHHQASLQLLNISELCAHA